MAACDEGGAGARPPPRRAWRPARAGSRPCSSEPWPRWPALPCLLTPDAPRTWRAAPPPG